MDLWNELQRLLDELRASLKQLRENGSNYASSEQAYKMALRQHVLELREMGEPVGIINLVCYGDENVSELRRIRDCAEAVYKANQEAINVLKLQIRIVENQMEREWSNAEHLTD